MEHCKYCEAELEEGNSVCPSCGKDNAEIPQEPEAEAVTAEVLEQEPAQKMPEKNPQEETQPEEAQTEAAETEGDGDSGEKVSAGEGLQEPEPASADDGKSGKKKSPGKVAAAVVGLVVLAAVLVSLVLWGMESSPLRAAVESWREKAAMKELIPEDGDPSNETCKGSYSASDKKVIAARDTVVATAGDYELTLGELQIYYWQEVSSFLNQYGAYAAYFGLDYTQPLDTQTCTIMEGRTWQQYFLASALNSWRTYQALYAQAVEENFEMEQELADYVASIPATMETEAVSKGFEGAEDLLKYNVGAGATVEDYVKFMETYYRGYSYFNNFYTSLTATEDEIEAMFALHEEEYAQQGLTRDSKTVNVRHILIYPEGATAETIRTETFPEEAWAAAETSAHALLDQWLLEDQTEEYFASLANEHSQDGGSNTNGGLYTDVYEGDMVEAFDAWCFDPERQVGDYGIVKTEFGYHIMFYSGDTLLWPSCAESDVINEKTNNMVDAAVEKLPIQVMYDKILLAVVDLSA